MHTNPDKPARAILAARHAALAEGVRGMLAFTFPEVCVVADLDSLQEGARHLRPNLIVVDLPLAGSTAPEILRMVRSVLPGAPVIVLTVYDQATVARMALDAGAQGVVLRRTAGIDFLEAVEVVLHGGVYVSPGFGASDDSRPPVTG